MKTHRLKLVMIEWEDITEVATTWAEHKSLLKEKPINVVGIGIVVKQTKDHLVLANGFSPEFSTEGGHEAWQWVGTTSYPIGCVKKITVLKVVGFSEPFDGFKQVRTPR